MVDLFVVLGGFLLVGLAARLQEHPPSEVQSEPTVSDTQAIELPPVTVLPPAFDDLGYLAIRGETLEPAEFIGERQTRLLPDALIETPGTSVQRTGPGQASPFLHGFTGFRTLFVIDGFRFNNSTWRDGPNQYLSTIDSELIDRLEVRYGNGGVRYGPDAAGGTVVMHTRPAGSFIEGQDHSALVGLRVASADQSWVGHFEVGGAAGERLSYRFGATARNFSDLEGGRHVGVQEGTAWNSNSADLKLDWRAGEESSFELVHQRERQYDVPRTHRTGDGLAWHGTSVGTEREHDLSQYRDFTYGRWDWQEGGWFDRFTAGLGYHSNEETRDRTRSDLRFDDDEVDVDTLGSYLSAENRTDAGRIRFGADFYRDMVDSRHVNFNADGTQSSRGIQGAVGDDATYDLLGAFAEDELELAQDWRLTLGSRFSYAKADAHSVEDPVTGNRIRVEDEYQAISAETRLAYLFSEKTTGYVGAFRSVRMPNLSDLTRLDFGRSNEIETPSPGLDEETFTGFEIGARHAESRWTLEGGLYYTILRDLIVRFPTGNVIDGANEVQKSNSGDGAVYGVDTVASYRLADAWTLGGDFSYVFGEVSTPRNGTETEREPLVKLPPARGSMRLRFEPPDGRCFAEALAVMANDQSRLNSSDAADTQRIPVGGTPGFTVYTLRTGLEATDRLTLALALENLTNRDYRIHGSGVNEPGTNVVFSARWKF